MGQRFKLRSDRYNRLRRLTHGCLGLLASLGILSGLVMTMRAHDFTQSVQEGAGERSAGQGGQDVRELLPGVPIERELAGGEAHSYRITLTSGQYLRVVVDQRGIDVVARLFGSDGQQIAEVDSSNGTQGPEPLSLVAQASGDCRLEVQSLNKSAVAGRYEVRIDALRVPTPEDHSRIAAERIFIEAGQLYARGTRESLREAIKKYEEVLTVWRTIGDGYLEAETLGNCGAAYYALGEKQKALDYFEQALQLCHTLGNRRSETIALINLGAVYIDIEPRKAIDYLSQAIPLARSLGVREGETAALKNIGSAYMYLGQMRKALEYFQQLLPIVQALDDHLGEASALNSLGSVHSELGEYQKALEYFNQALELRRLLADREGEAITLNNIGVVYRNLGENRKALGYLSQSLELWRSLKDRGGEATLLNNIAGIYSDLGEYQRALDHYNQVLLIVRTQGDRRREGVVLNNIGGVYKNLGEKQKALEYFAQALELARAVGNRAGEATALSNIGSTYGDLGENQKALNYYTQAFRIVRGVGKREAEAGILNNIGFAYYSLGENEKALDYYNQALELARAIGIRPSEANALNNIGSVYARSGNKQGTLNYFRQALALSRNVGDRLVELRSLSWIARVERDSGNLIEARSQIEAALAIIESLRTKVTSQELRTSYFASKQDYYGFYIDLQMRLHQREPGKDHDAMALQANERARARSLLEILTESRADIRQGVDPALLERERSLQQQLNANEQYRMKLLSGKPTDERKAAVEKESRELLTQYQEVQAQIRANSPSYAALTQPQPLSLREIQQQVLDEDTLLLEYALGEERSFLWAVTPTSIKSYELPKRAEIETAAKQVYELMIQSKERMARGQAELVAARLSQVILGPVADQLGNKRLLIVSDGALQYIPFAALPAPRRLSVVSGPSSEDEKNNGQRTTDNGQPLIVDHEIVSLPSASVLAVLRKELAGRKPAPKTVAVLADPVFDKNDERVKAAEPQRHGDGQKEKAVSSQPPPSGSTSSSLVALPSDVERAARDAGLMSFKRLQFTRQEAEAITVLIPEEQRLTALDFEASRGTVAKADLSQYRIVHFATHGLLNSVHPELSGLVLSLVDERGEPQDGFLRLHEVYNLKLNADLVVLSACQTALGKEVKGEGLVGLTRGFMYAGAARVLVSLWNVSDAATAELMKRFYRGILKDGLRPAAALRAAQISMSKETRWSAPYFWAGFVLQGEWK